MIQINIILLIIAQGVTDFRSKSESLPQGVSLNSSLLKQ